MGFPSSCSAVIGSPIDWDGTRRLLKKRLTESEGFRAFCEARYLSCDTDRAPDAEDADSWIEAAFCFVEKDLGAAGEDFQLVCNCDVNDEESSYHLSMASDGICLRDVASLANSDSARRCWSEFAKYLGVCDFDRCTVYGTLYVSL